MIPDAIANALGRQLDESTYASIDDLNLVLPEQVEDARRLLSHKRLYAFAYLRHFAPRESFSNIESFIDGVVLGGQSPSTWERGDRVASIRVYFPHFLRATAADAIANLRKIEGAEPSWVQSPQGAPGVLVRGTTYRWEEPKGVDAVLLGPDSRPELIDDFVLGFRRWLANRFADWWFRSLAKTEMPRDGELGELSTDMRAALAALDREVVEVSDKPPGFRGPDDWYRDGGSFVSKSFQELLAAVVAAPNEDAPRLEYAEYMRRQDPELARFVELQVAAGAERRRKREPRFGIYPSEDRRLLEKNAARWARTIAKYTARHDFDRGFITEVGIDPHMFLEYGDWLLKNAPIRHVEFGAAREGAFPLREIFDNPILERLDSLALINRDLTDDDVAVIAASSHLGSLLRLDLSLNYLSIRAFEALAAAPATRKLLVVGRQQASRGTYFPGPIYAATGEDDGYGEPIWDWTPMTDEGADLERKYGYIPWLHPQQNGCDWYDARYYVEKGLLPVRPAAS